MDTQQFNEIEEINQIKVIPNGWREVTIEYGIKKYGTSASLLFCWRVENTNLIFEAPLNQVYEDCQGNYEEHFIKVLEVFWKDFVEWKSQGFPKPWMRKHKEQFGKYIYTY